MLDFRHTDALTLMRSLPDASIDALISDPPYGTTGHSWDAFESWPEFFVEARRVCKPDAPIVLFGAGMFTLQVTLQAADIFRYRMVWHKPNSVGFLDANRRPLPQHEDIMVFCQHGYGTYNPQKTAGEPYVTSTGSKTKTYNHFELKQTINNGDRFPTTVLAMGQYKNEDRFHPTQKPLDLMEYLVLTYSNKEGVILDPFSGSGSTGVAALRQGRKFIGCERDAEFYRKASKRLSTTNERLFTGG